MASAPQQPQLPMFYNDLMPLNTRDHMKFRNRQSDSAPWLSKQHVVPITADEFIQAGRHYPVVFSQVLPNSTDHTDGKKLLYFGDLSLAASFGDRRSTTIQVSEHATINSGNVFEQDEIAIRGTERFDINCHDTGDSSEAGPIVSLSILDAS